LLTLIVERSKNLVELVILMTKATCSESLSLDADGASKADVRVVETDDLFNDLD
jgi:hypothetical protein